MSTAENYKFYLARSRGAINNNDENMTFHFRARRMTNMTSGPYLIFDNSREKPVEIRQSTDAEITKSTISVYLKETDTPPEGPEVSLFGEDYLFGTENPPDYSKLSGQILVYVNSQPETTKDEIVHDQMDAEYPMD